MTTYYVGPGGNDGNTGLSWAQRFLTLNGAEDEPVAAGDTVYVGPGVYRETLTCDVDGSSGNIITYIGDVTGENTDGVGGVVRITGSDNDTTSTRTEGILANSRDYRTFRGFQFDFISNGGIYSTDSETNWTIEDCGFQNLSTGIRVLGSSQANFTITRCFFFGLTGTAITFSNASTVDNSGHVVTNCIVIGCNGADMIAVTQVGDIIIRNCLFVGGIDGVDVITSVSEGHPVIVENCIFVALNNQALEGAAVGDIDEDYNTFYANGADRSNVDTGANSQTYHPMLSLPILYSGASQASGFKFPWWFGELSEWSPIRRIAGNREPDVDLNGIPRPFISAKNSWGPLQFVDRELESTTVQAGSYARVIHEAGQSFVRRIPTDGTEITVTLYMRYEEGYAASASASVSPSFSSSASASLSPSASASASLSPSSSVSPSPSPGDTSLPRMIIKQPGQADYTDTMTVAADTWEQLSITLTPAANPNFIEVWAENRNTAANPYDVFYDTLDVS